ncbi:MAG: PAS domain-containing protein [Desulfamplus sp.]|nr:PAS domain-containing protein [Desulfamplus sp.]MBF0414021.1 PAS domain-containing protein [Desulfamplus sp.]
MNMPEINAEIDCNYCANTEKFTHCPYGYRVLNYVTVGICIFDKNYHVSFWNRCLANWSHVEPSDIVGKNIMEYFPTLNSPGFKERVDYVFKGGPPVIFSSQLHRNTIPCTLSDGSYMVQKTVISSVPSPETGEFFALMAIENATELSRKVSEYRTLRNQAMEEVKLRKKVEDDLRESNKMLLEHQEITMHQERIKVLLEMAGATAHELNQPLMTLLGTIELLNMTQNVSEETVKYLKNIEKSAKRIADIVSKIQQIKQYQTKRYLNDVSIIDFHGSTL